uniref:NFKB inhibitor delta n=1 Tax=Ficedula albicollis TaxID=59894 RepID=A0A803VCK9_FICAL
MGPEGTKLSWETREVAWGAPWYLGDPKSFPLPSQAFMSSGVPVNVEARNFEGQTPLHCAVLAHNASLQGGSGEGSPTPQDRFRCVELLLQMGADSSSQDTKSSLTALHLAVRGGNLALAHLLLRQPGMAPRLVNMKVWGTGGAGGSSGRLWGLTGGVLWSSLGSLYGLWGVKGLWEVQRDQKGTGGFGVSVESLGGLEVWVSDLGGL